MWKALRKKRFKIKKAKQYQISENPTGCGDEAVQWCRGPVTSQEPVSWNPGPHPLEAVQVPTSAAERQSVKSNPIATAAIRPLTSSFVFNILNPNSLIYLKTHLSLIWNSKQNKLLSIWRKRAHASPDTYLGGTSWGAAKPCHRTLRRLSPRGEPTKTLSTSICGGQGTGLLRSQPSWDHVSFPPRNRGDHECRARRTRERTRACRALVSDALCSYSLLARPGDDLWGRCWTRATHVRGIQQGGARPRVPRPPGHKGMGPPPPARRTHRFQATRWEAPSVDKTTPWQTMDETARQAAEQRGSASCLTWSSPFTCSILLPINTKWRPSSTRILLVQIQH